MSSFFKVVQPSGILDGTQMVQFNREIDDIVATGVADILVNFKNVTFMDSSGLGALLVAFKTAKAAGGKLYLCSVRPEIRILLDIANVEQFFEIFADQESFENAFEVYQEI
jgi:anti-sigma B factor antagonist